MARDHERVRTLYGKLLGLYPLAFRERFGESMEQTFADLCNERRRRTERGWPGFALGLFVETAVGIGRERVLLLVQGGMMKAVATDLGPAVLISFLLVLPFVILEFLFNTPTRQSAPGILALFGFLWLLPTAFIVVLAPMARTVRAGSGIMANPVALLVRVAFLVLVAMVWGSLLVDQLPCFLGVPNCD
jgi:hypothetical protein